MKSREHAWAWRCRKIAVSKYHRLMCNSIIVWSLKCLCLWTVPRELTMSRDIYNIVQSVSHIKLLGHITVASVKGECVWLTWLNYGKMSFSLSVASQHCAEKAKRILKLCLPSSHPIIMWPSVGVRVKCCTLSVCLSIQCLRFSWNGKAVETSNFVER